MNRLGLQGGGLLLIALTSHSSAQAHSFQSIAYRWAHSLLDCGTFERSRFVRYYTSLGSSSAIPLARSGRVIP